MLTKKLIKSHKQCQVLFELPEAELPTEMAITSIDLVGDFNDWKPTATPMRLNKQKCYQAKLTLEPEKSYQFRYLLNGEQWLNDRQADDYVLGAYGQDNCIVVT